MVIVNLVYDIYNPPFGSFAHYYLMWLLFTLLVTLVLFVLAIDYRYEQNTISSITKSVRRWKLKSFIRDFFLDMLPIDWEIKIRKKHLERLDREEREEKL